MINIPFDAPKAKNTTIKNYIPGSEEHLDVINTCENFLNTKTTVALYIDGEDITTKDLKIIKIPHDHKNNLGSYAITNENNTQLAIDSSLEAAKDWMHMDWKSRAAIFLKAAKLIETKYRSKIIAATMLGQSKNIFQAETDAACQLIDAINFNIEFANDIFKNQPNSTSEVKNIMEYRPLEGFVYAISPFNFTAIAANLWIAPVLLGNVCVWKPSDHQVLSAKIIMDVFKEARLPKGVVNMIFGDAEKISNQIFKHEKFAGLHFTGSTIVFKKLWTQIGNNIDAYISYPKIVGETGGKGFIWAHESSNIEVLVAAICRGSFEYQGQKCSAASRVYIPKGIWSNVEKLLIEEIKSMKIGNPIDTSNFINAIIHEQAYQKLTSQIESTKKDPDAKIIVGGGYNTEIGYFIEPTVILTSNPNYITLKKELFGPIVTIYLYENNAWKDSLNIVDNTSEYGLTGGVFANNEEVIDTALDHLINSAGNIYINDKPTGATIGQQPFGGARGSGTNDKAGSALNLLRWLSPRTIKKVTKPIKDYRYPFLG